MSTILNRNDANPQKRRRSAVDSRITGIRDDEKENMTVDGAAMIQRRNRSAPKDTQLKRLRSESVGPGRLTNGSPNRLKQTAKAPIKSILKQSISLSPAQELALQPEFWPYGRLGTRPHDPDTQTTIQTRAGLLLEFSADTEIRHERLSITGPNCLQNPFGSATSVDPDDVFDTRAPKSPSSAIGEDISQQAKGQREKERRGVLEKREARRKSLANRRVSFAPEATLHTWNVIELVQDSTSSSGTASSNGRPSLSATSSHLPSPNSRILSPAPSYEFSEPPSTPPQDPMGTEIQASPAQSYVRTRNSKRRRRSSQATTTSEDDSTSRDSPLSPQDASQEVESDGTYSEGLSVDGPGDANIGNPSSDNDSTTMSLDSADVTTELLPSGSTSNASTASTGRLNEALRQAAAQAGTRGIDYDENGDLSMEIANDQVTAAFQSWARSRVVDKSALQELASLEDVENQERSESLDQTSEAKVIDRPPNASGLGRESTIEAIDTVTMDVAMDMTRPVGRILPVELTPGDVITKTSVQQLGSSAFRSNSVNERRSSGEGSSLGDVSMDLTVLVGGIQSSPWTPDEREVIDLLGDSNAMQVTQLPDQREETDVEHPPLPLTSSIRAASVEVPDSPAGYAQTKPISLREFLDLTGIHFMDISTTKRRYTDNIETTKQEGKSGLEQSGAVAEEHILEKRVYDASCVQPMLELYQHSCLELKKYMSEGRTIIRQIEVDTLAENPGLFHEYMAASSDLQAIMDSQFKNIKTHARLSSKAMWYGWRRKLYSDLHLGLSKIAKGLEEDDAVFRQKELLLSSTLPRMLATIERLSTEQEALAQQAEEIASSNQVELAAARDNLVDLEVDLEQKQTHLASLQSQIRAQQEAIEFKTERKMSLSADIVQAEKMREEYRGRSVAEVGKWKAMVVEIERGCGWTILSTVGNVIQMTYKRQLLLALRVSSYNSPPEPRSFFSAEVSLCDSMRTAKPQPERQEPSDYIYVFFIDLVNEHLRAERQSLHNLADMFALISNLWSKAVTLAEEVRSLHLFYPSSVAMNPEKTGFLLQLPVLLSSLRTKLALTFEIACSALNSQQGAVVSVLPHAVIVYGNQFDERKIKDFLARRICQNVSAGTRESKTRRRWVEAVKALSDSLASQGQRG